MTAESYLQSRKGATTVRRRVKLKITTTREQTIQLTAAGLRARCPVCQCEVDILTREQAIVMLKIREQALNRLIAHGLVHTVYTVSGTPWVCKDSLLSY